MQRHALVTGGAGFIGSHLVDRLLAEGWRVTVVDNFDPFYDPAIMEQNVAQHLKIPSFSLYRLDIRDLHGLRRELKDHYDVIVHLAAKAGVRPSIQGPVTYQKSTLPARKTCWVARSENGNLSLFRRPAYGISERSWRETIIMLMPISPYASTKVSGEPMGTFIAISTVFALSHTISRCMVRRGRTGVHKFARSCWPVSRFLFGDGTTDGIHLRRRHRRVGGKCILCFRYEIFNSAIIKR